jgi:hypothetical protein
MTEKLKQLTEDKGQKLMKLEQRKARKLDLAEIPETGELEIKKHLTLNSPEEKIRFPKKDSDRYQLMPDEFEDVQNAIDDFNFERRTVEVYSDSIESALSYNSLVRVMNKYFHQQYSYYRSEAGGALSPEAARKAVYRQKITDDEAIELFDILMSKSTDQINFWHLMELYDNSPRMAQNMWEMIKREAAQEFETGHRAASAFEPADYMTDAWNRASYLGIRESFCDEWQPNGGIELSMIDAIAQAWLQLQYWTEQSVKRARTRPREENSQFNQWKERNRLASPKQWDNGFWDIPTVSEQAAIEHAAQMADRWQRMYFRAIRNLRDWRRYTPQVTINNPQQVNIATDGGQQINLTKSDEDITKQINR